MTETIDTPAPQMTAEAWWGQILFKQYGLQASLTPLDGEYDLNFAVHQDDVLTHVLKVMRPGCDRSLVEMQCEALDHIAKRTPELAVPHVAPASSGALFISVKDQRGSERLVWLITALPGRLYGDVRP